MCPSGPNNSTPPLSLSRERFLAMCNRTMETGHTQRARRARVSDRARNCGLLYHRPKATAVSSSPVRRRRRVLALHGRARRCSARRALARRAPAIAPAAFQLRARATRTYSVLGTPGESGRAAAGRRSSSSAHDVARTCRCSWRPRAGHGSSTAHLLASNVYFRVPFILS